MRLIWWSILTLAVAAGVIVVMWASMVQPDLPHASEQQPNLEQRREEARQQLVWEQTVRSWNPRYDRTFPGLIEFTLKHGAYK